MSQQVFSPPLCSVIRSHKRDIVLLASLHWLSLRSNVIVWPTNQQMPVTSLLIFCSGSRSELRLLPCYLPFAAQHVLWLTNSCHVCHHGGVQPGRPTADMMVDWNLKWTRAGSGLSSAYSKCAVWLNEYDIYIERWNPRTEVPINKTANLIKLMPDRGALCSEQTSKHCPAAFYLESQTKGFVLSLQKWAWHEMH